MNVDERSIGLSPGDGWKGVGVKRKLAVEASPVVNVLSSREGPEKNLLAVALKSTVLPEEEYTASLQSIIERDFYPDLASIRREARELGGELHDDGAQVSKPAATQAGSVDAFHMLFTSEDNASFVDIVRMEERAKEIPRRVLYGEDTSVKLLRGPEDAANDAPRIEKPQGWRYSVKNNLMHGPSDMVPPRKAIIGVSKESRKVIRYENTRYPSSTSTRPPVHPDGLLEASTLEPGDDADDDRPGPVNGYNYLSPFTIAKPDERETLARKMEHEAAESSRRRREPYTPDVFRNTTARRTPSVTDRTPKTPFTPRTPWHLRTPRTGTPTSLTPNARLIAQRMGLKPLSADIQRLRESYRATPP